MSEHQGGGDAHGLHAPQPSISPPIIGLAVMLLSFGILFGVPLIVLGGLIFVVGIATWLIDDARAYLRAGEPSGDGRGHH